MGGPQVDWSAQEGEWSPTLLPVVSPEQGHGTASPCCPAGPSLSEASHGGPKPELSGAGAC